MIQKDYTKVRLIVRETNQEEERSVRQKSFLREVRGNGRLKRNGLRISMGTLKEQLET